MRFRDDDRKIDEKKVMQVVQKFNEEAGDVIRRLLEIRNRSAEMGERDSEHICKKYGVESGNYGLLSLNKFSSVMDGEIISAVYDEVQDEYEIVKENDPDRKQKYYSFIGEMMQIEMRVMDKITELGKEIPGVNEDIPEEAYLRFVPKEIHAFVAFGYNGKEGTGFILIPTVKYSPAVAIAFFQL